MKPEVLAPAGAPECLPAAVAGGADAVYLGLRHFNARGRAENFRKADLPRHVAYLHRHGLKCYVVLNTLVHDDEHAKALDLAWHAQVAGVDAAIIQDLGLWRLLRRTVPSLHLHASTQMTVHDPSQIAVLAGLGAQRVILARELSLPEIRASAAEATRHGIEIEHFVHGALCYAFSGQCLMSNFAGCRSANRGTCAQNCRFAYETDSGVETEISMRDLALVDRIGELAEAGVASLKIEGRLKGPDYVYTVARAYREAVDAWAAKRSADPAIAREPLTEVFARPFTSTPLDADYGPSARLHRAEPLRDREADATLVSLDRRAGIAVIKAARRPAAGLGYAFAIGMWNDGFLVTAVDEITGDRWGSSGEGRTPERRETGVGRPAAEAPSPFPGRKRWRLRVRADARGPRAPEGTPLFVNRDQRRERDANAAMAAVPLPPEEQGGVPCDLTIMAKTGAAIELHASTADGRRASITGPVVQAATGRPLTSEALADSAGALGGSGFILRKLDAQLGGACFVPASELKRLRRELVAALTAQPVGTAPAYEPPAVAQPRQRTTGLWVMAGSEDAAQAATDAGATRVAIEDATLDIWKAGRWPLAAGRWLRLPATAPVPALNGAVLAGHIGLLAAARSAGLPAVADAFCNVYSTETLAALAELGASGAILSYELSGREVARLAARSAALPIELAITVHGRVPSMLTRQDHALPVGGVRTIRAVPQEGGLPYELQRRVHDTVVWEGRRLCAPEPAAVTAGLVDWWVLELADLAPAAVRELVTAYAGLLAGTTTASQVEAVAERHAPHGLFPGHLIRGARELDEIAERT
jgi:putative protease